MRKRIVSVVIVVAVILAVAGAAVNLLPRSTMAAQEAPAAEVQSPSRALPLLSDNPYIIADIAEVASPATVYISVEWPSETVETYRRQYPSIDPFGSFFDYFFGDPFFSQPQQQIITSAGSGFIIDESGIVLTNQHVVGNKGEGQTITVVVDAPGLEREYKAEIIGSDYSLDLAVLQIINENGDVFPTLPLGDSDASRVGEWTIAIGNPYGREFEHTVTVGVLSAKGREITVYDSESGRTKVYKNLMQTDAAINRGNSGGPLVNMNAEVIGINSFISTSSGSSAGIGFAVPSQLFVRVYNQILETGKVSRGWIGVSMNSLPFTPAMAEFFKVKQGGGVLVTQLIDEKGNPSTEGPAAKAGVKPEDVVIEFDGNKIMNNQDFLMAVTNTVPGRTAKMKVVRDGVERVLDVVLAERTRETQEERRYSFEESQEPPRTEIGLEFDNVPSSLAKILGSSGGVMVTSVKRGSLADEAGLIGPTRTEEGEAVDVIVEANGRPVKDKDDLFNTVKAMKSGTPVVFKFMRVLPRSEPTPSYTSITKP